ncbi:MAG: PepSY-like domain-containing protein [Chitinophagales bacterium]
MKKLFTLFIIIISFAISARAQKLKESQVPAPAVSAFHKMYPEVKEYSWSKDEGNYEAEYDMNKMEMAATFDKDGNLVETEKGIPVKDLPAGIADYVSKNYSGASIKEASQVTDAKGVKTYEAEIKGKDLIFDENGKFIREEKED